MDKLRNLIEEVLKKGFASSEERMILVTECQDLDQDEMEEFFEDMKKIETLPMEEVKPDTLEGEEIKEIANNGDIVTRAERRAQARLNNKA